MKKIVATFLCLSILMLCACKKDIKGNNPNCPGFNTCFVIDGKSFAGNATCKQSIQGNYKIFFENGTPGSANWETVAIDINGTSSGTYKVIGGTTRAGEARLEAMRSSGPLTTVYNSIEGTLVLSSTSKDKWTGTFNIKCTKDQGSTHDIINGSFFEVPAK